MNPRATSLPPASIVRAASSAISSAMSAMRPSLIPTSERKPARPVPSTTVPPLITTSNMATPRASKVEHTNLPHPWRSTVPAVATIDWYGCATFRLRVGGLTVFLDAYVDRSPDAPGTGLTADHIDDCDWIVIGHAHFDHLYGAERIM